MKKLLLLAAFASLFMATSVFATCDTKVANATFQVAVQKAASEDPSKLAAIQEDIVKIQSELPGLVEQNKNDEICKAFDDMTAKLK